MHSADHIAYYRGVMRSNIGDGAEVAVGSMSHELWVEHGEEQFQYLVTHGLRRDMRMLEIGCGNLRAGRLFIDYLGVGHYHGVDISPEILTAAAETVTSYRLQSRRPRITLVSDLELGFAPDHRFDVVHAHSVFSHSPVDVIEQCLANVGRVLAPSGFFDFTYHATEGPEYHVLHEDFYYRTDTLVELAVSHGLRAQPMEDWRARHVQSKLRVIRAS
jgi:SAM-dependent methyltransferase